MGAGATIDVIGLLYDLITRLGLRSVWKLVTVPKMGTSSYPFAI
jgi:hypothetical protein